MMLDIKPIKTDANCFINNLIIQITGLFSFDHRPLFLRYFNDYLNWCEATNILDMNPCYADEEKMGIDKLIGFRWIHVDFDSTEKLFSFVKNSLNKKQPLVLSI